MKLIKFNLLALTLSISLLGCQQTKEKESNPIEAIEKGHHKNDFLSKDILRFDLQLFFGGNERLNAEITVMTNSTKAIIALKDSSQLIVDGDDVYYSSNYKNTHSVRFDAYTWTYFMLFPYKLSDPGTIWSNQKQAQLMGDTFNFHTLTFEANTGDAPDDWYKIYSDQETNLIKAAAYIVTAGKTKKEAEEDPHAIVYSDYKAINKIPIATNWTFWGWQSAKGLTDQLGYAELSKIEFLNQEEVSFDVPRNYIKSNREK